MDVEALAHGRSAGATVTSVDHIGHSDGSGLRGWWAVGLLATIFAFAMIDRAVLSMVIEPVKADLHMSDSAFGLVQGFAIALFYVICAMPFGWAADRFDRRYVLAVGIGIWSLASASCAFARTFTDLFVSRSLVGAGESALGPNGYPLVASWVSGRRLPLAIMLFVLGGVSGNAFGQFIGGPLFVFLSHVPETSVWLLGQKTPWRALFLVTGLPGLLLAALVLATPKGAKRAAGCAPARSAPGFVRFFKHHIRFYLSYIGGIGLQQASMFSVILWNSAYLMRVHHWQPDRIGLIFGSVQLLVSVLAAIFHGWMMGRLHQAGHKDAYPRWQRWMGCLAIPALVLTYMQGSIAATLIGFALFHAAIGGTLIAGPTALQYATPLRFRGRASALYVLIASLVGSALGPSVIGFVTDHVFGNEQEVGWAIAFCGIGFNAGAILLYTICLPSCRAVIYETENASPQSL